MSTYRFEDWSARQYQDLGLVQPGDTIEADCPPDGRFWVLVPAKQDKVPVPAKADIEQADKVEVEQKELELAQALMTAEGAPLLSETE